MTAPWWQRAVIYQVYPRSYADSNGDGIGDLPGVISKLDHLEWLGVDAIWLSPTFPSPNADWGYDVADYLGVHPDFGTPADLERLIGAVPATMAPALTRRAYFFVPLAIADTGEPLIAPVYTVDYGDRAVCHRNATFGSMDAVFISTRLVEDRFGLAFEFFINVAHNFVDAAGVPASFSDLVWSQAEAQTRGETSLDAWEARRRAQEPVIAQHNGSKKVDEQARNQYAEAAFSDALAIYMLSLAVDFDYHDLREREYPLLIPVGLAERLRHVANLFPPNAGYDFQILYRKRG